MRKSTRGQPRPGATAPVVDRPQKWRARALCAQADPEAWFPEKGGSVRQATAICRRCPVQAECLDYALAHVERFGVWGGLTWEQRRELLRGGRRAAA